MFNKCDIETKRILKRLLEEGTLDKNPRPHYEEKYTGEDLKEGQWVKDGSILCTPAHTLSYNHEMVTYDLSKGEFPLCTLRPTAIKSAIAEIIWIYFKQSNDLVIFDELLGKNTWDTDHKINNWWEEWAIKDKDGNYILNEAGHPTIGSCYGETVRHYKLMDNCIDKLKNDPDNRRNIINLWQETDFLEAHGLKPCAFLTQWNVRHTSDGDYLDMCLTQRSSDFCTAGVINQAQYAVLLLIVASYTGYKPGKFTWFVNNIQCYDRHIEQAKEMLSRDTIPCMPFVEILESKPENIFDIMPADIKIVNYPINEIKDKNPQLTFDIGI